MINFSDMNDRLNDLEFSQSIREAQKWDLTHNFSDLLDNPYADISNFAENLLLRPSKKDELTSAALEGYNNYLKKTKHMYEPEPSGGYKEYQDMQAKIAEATQKAQDTDTGIMNKLAEGNHNVIGSMTGAVQALGGKVGGNSLFKSLVRKAAGLGLDPLKILGVSNTGLGLGAIAAGALGAAGLTVGIIKLIKAIKKKRGGKQAVGQSIQQSNVANPQAVANLAQRA